MHGAQSRSEQAPIAELPQVVHNNMFEDSNMECRAQLACHRLRTTIFDLSISASVSGRAWEHTEGARHPDSVPGSYQPVKGCLFSPS
jgi:hypothetical protein